MPALVKLILASRSPARLATLRAAGVTPGVVVSDVDEGAVVADLTARFGELGVEDVVLALAEAKASSVAAVTDRADAIVIGCDSMLEFDGVGYGRPTTADDAVARWRMMRGRTGTLHTGHWIIDLRPTDAGGTGATLGATSSCIVHFAAIDDDEIAAYVATGEPLQVAGAFTIDGLGGPYIDGVEGDPHGVVGISLPLVRELLAQIGVPFSAVRG